MSLAQQLDYMHDAGERVSCERIPSTLDEFVAMRDQLSSTPQGGALAFIVAMYVYTNVDKALGAQFLCVSMDADHVKKAEEVTASLRAPVAVKGYIPSPNVLRNMDQRCGPHSNPRFDKSHVSRSYFVGTTPQAGYALPAELSILVKRQASDARDPGRIFIVSSGADLPKPIRMVANGRGVWKAFEWSSLQASVRDPVRAQKRDVDEL